SSPDSFALLDSELNFVEVNKTLLKFLGKTKEEEIIGKNLLDINPAIKGTGRYEEYLEVIKTGKSLFRDDFIPDPKFGDVHLNMRTFKVSDGLGIIVTDITEHKKAEEALRTAQKYSRNIIDSSLDMIISVGENRRIVEFNHSAQETFGYGRDEIIDKHIDILYADTKEGEKVYETTRKSGQFSGEILNKRKNGELFYSFLSSSTQSKTEASRVSLHPIGH
ncbi:MAG: hypothetical protein HeimAB125_23360, partial [Candidatus Heimdallarchaeota archaeon AB_125]